MEWILGLVTLFFGYKWHASANENEKLKDRLNLKKDELYSNFINLYMQLVQKKTEEKDVIEKMREFNEKLTLVGSNKVILTYGDFFQKLQQSKTEEDNINNMRYFGELIITMREDLGNKDWLNSLKWFDVLRPWVKDMDNRISQNYFKDEKVRRFYCKY